jgi:hypothetical protein
MFTFSFTMWIYEKYLLICKAVFMIYSPYLVSNGISVCSVFSQCNYISLFIVLQSVKYLENT